MSPRKAVHGQQVDVLGENLDLVSALRLTCGGRSFAVPYITDNNSRLVMTIPRSVDPGQTYVLVFENTAGREKSTGLTLAVDKTDILPTPHPTSMPTQRSKNASAEQTLIDSPKPTIVFADLNWTSAQLQNAIARFIIENGYGHPTDAIPGSPIQLWQSIIDGKVHVLMETWLPQYERWWDEGLDQGSIIPLGKSLDDNWQSAFVVPTYVVEENPGLKSVYDLPEYKDLFATASSEGKAVLVTCTATWACAEINVAQVRAYGLEEIIHFEYPVSEEALFNSLRNAYERGSPWLGYLWGPTKVATDLELTLLDEPPYSDTCWDAHKGCAYPTSKVRIVVHPSLLSSSPDVMDFLRKWDLDTDIQVEVEEHFSRNEEDFEKTAVWFLKNYEAVWIRWVTPDVFEKVRNTVSEQ